MVDITEIMDMLDWYMPLGIQNEGISLARNIGTIIPFIQPLTPKHNKNVWGNCAVIISERSDEEIGLKMRLIFGCAISICVATCL